MEPRIQYARTADGVSIAFWTLGEGPPLVIMPPTVMGSHGELEWQWPEWRQWYERLARQRKLVRYDGRGGGLSDRNVADFSLDARVLDLEAVVDRLGLERLALLGAIHSGPAAIAYAALHPERVSHLLLWHAYARASDYAASPQLQALTALSGHDWELYTETVAHARLGWSMGDSARRFAEYMREGTTPEAAWAVFAAIREYDVTALLSRVRPPTLVLQRRQLSSPDVAIARGLVTRIPAARLALLEGTSLVPYVGDMEAVLDAIDEFLGQGQPSAAVAAPPVPGAFRTVLFTDVEGSTALTQRLGDAKAREVLREHERIVRECLRTHGGAEVKTMGDGFMASFASSTRALECAIAVQRAFAEWNADVGARHASPLQVRRGLNAGEPIEEGGDLFGATVILAARIAAKAEGGEILVANAVRELCAGKGFLFADRGEFVAKGIEEPVRVHEVRWREEA